MVEQTAGITLPPAVGAARVPTDRGFSIAALPPLLRVLLTTDGTVTEVLAAYFGERIGVRVLGQDFRAYEGRYNPELEVAPGTRVLNRSIVLFGEESGTARVAAHSRIVPARLPAGMQELLLEERQPLGRLMQQYRFETFRELTGSGRYVEGCVPIACAPCVAVLQGDDGASELIWRTYRVIHGGQPVMSITEFFPEAIG